MLAVCQRYCTNHQSSSNKRKQTPPTICTLITYAISQLYQNAPRFAILYLYFLHHQFVDFLLQSQDFFLQSQTVGVEDWFPQRPLFLQLCDLF